MKTTLEEISPVKKKILIEIDAQEVKEKLERAYRKLGKSVRISGFRPGKAPRALLERRYGNEVLDDLKRDLISESLPQAMEETDTFPIVTPVIESDALNGGEAFRYSAVMEVRPKFELEGYKGLEIEKEQVEVTDEEVDGQLEEVRKSRATFKALEEDRGIREGDYAIVDYEAFEGAEPLEGVRAENASLSVGSGDFHPQFEKGLIGLKKGDTAEIAVDFEESHSHAALAGKKVTFKVRLADVKVMDLPELNDAFARDLDAGFNDLEGLRARIKENLLSKEERRIDKELKQGLLSKIAAGVDFELPGSLVESEIRQAVEKVRQNLLRAGSNLEKAGLTEEKLREDFRPAAEKRVKEKLILSEIAARDDLSISESELSQGFGEAAQGIGQEAEVIRRYYEANNLVDSFRESLLEEKTLNYLVKNANIKELQAEGAPKGEN